MKILGFGGEFRWGFKSWWRWRVPQAGWQCCRVNKGIWGWEWQRGCCVKGRMLCPNCTVNTTLVQFGWILTSAPSLWCPQCARFSPKAWWESWDLPPAQPPAPLSATSVGRRRWVTFLCEDQSGQHGLSPPPDALTLEIFSFFLFSLFLPPFSSLNPLLLQLPSHPSPTQSEGCEPKAPAVTLCTYLASFVFTAVPASSTPPFFFFFLFF